MIITAITNYIFSANPNVIPQVEDRSKVRMTILQANAAMSKLLAEIEWDVDLLKEGSKEKKFYKNFHKKVTALEFEPYYMTNTNITILTRINCVLLNCPNVNTLFSKEGHYPGAMTGFLFWKRPVYNPLATFNFYKQIDFSKIRCLSLLSHSVAVEIFYAIAKRQANLTELEIKVSEDEKLELNLHDADGKTAQFNEAIRMLKDLRVFTIHSSMVNNSHVEMIVKNSPQLKASKFIGCSGVTDEGFSKVGELTSLEALGAIRLLKVSKYAWSCLRSLPRLTSLQINGTSLLAHKNYRGPGLLEIISKNLVRPKRLTYLNVNNCVIDYIKELNYLFVLANLQELHINVPRPRSVKVPEKAIECLSRFHTQLQFLDISGWELTPVAACVADLKSFKHLTHVILGGAPGFHLIAAEVIKLKKDEDHKDLKIDIKPYKRFELGDNSSYYL